MNTDELVFRDVVLGDLQVADYADWCESLVTHGNDDEDVVYLAANPDLHWEQFDKVIRKIKDKTELGAFSQDQRWAIAEAFIIRQFSAGQMSFDDLIRYGDVICRASEYAEPYTVWYALHESLGYLDNEQGTRFYELDPASPHDSALAILRANRKMV